MRPFHKKYPFLSLWLSGANAVLGAARGRTSAETKRQAARLASQGIRQAAHLWTEALTPPAAKRKERRG